MNKPFLSSMLAEHQCDTVLKQIFRDCIETDSSVFFMNLCIMTLWNHTLTSPALSSIRNPALVVHPKSSLLCIYSSFMSVMHVVSLSTLFNNCISIIATSDRLQQRSGTQESHIFSPFALALFYYSCNNKMSLFTPFLF